MYRNMHPSRIRQKLEFLLHKEELDQEDLKTLVQMNIALADRVEKAESEASRRPNLTFGPMY